jgi:LysR family transcriptional regulator, regulator for genes of the gallate degradation pathway
MAMMATVLGLRRLLVFDAVCRTGGIGEAAHAIGLTQPAVSLAIIKLESRFGAELLERGQRGSELTPQGLLLHRRVRRMLQQLEQALSPLLGSPAPPASLVGTVCRQLTDAQIRCHVAIAETGSAAQAARHLGVSQPAVHRAARMLEQTVRTTLYRRHAHGVSVNLLGIEFARRLRLAAHEITQATDELAALRGGAGGTVAIGVLPTLPQHLLARAIGALLRAHPDITVTLREAAHTQLMVDLRMGKIDFIVGALCLPGPQPDVMESALFADPQAIVVRRGHALSRRPNITARDLAEYDWIVPPAQMVRRRVIETILEALPSQPRRVVETSSLPMILALLAESDCLTVLPRSQTQRSGLHALTVDTLDSGRKVGVTTRTDWLPTPVQSEFIAYLHSVFKEGVLF